MSRPGRHPSSRRAAACAAVGALALAVLGCGSDGDRVSRFSAGGVDARVEVTGWDGRSGTVVATLTPAPGFHLYSASLPADGIDGVGQRTRLGVGGALRRSGRARVDVRPRTIRVRGVRRALPVYPEGPIRVELDVHRSEDADAEPRAILSYGACSDRACNVPVVDRRVPVALP